MTVKLYTAAAATAIVLASGSGAQAADLGVLTSLDVCDSLGLSGLTLSSDSNCLVISGEVEYELVWGDYDADHTIVDLAYEGESDVFVGNGELDWESVVETSLTIEGTASSDFGPAIGVITIETTDEVVVENLALDDEEHVVEIDEAYVSIGDQTVLMVGLKDSILDDGDDGSFTYQEMFNEDEASGVGYNSDSTGTDIDDGGHVIQVVHDLGNGFRTGVALEALDESGTLVGVVQYESDTLDSHVSVLADGIPYGEINDWAVHTSTTLSLDNFSVRGAAAFNNDGWWNVLGTAETEFDIFTLAIGAEATSEDEYGLAASVAAEVVDGVTLNLGSRAFRESDDDITVDTVAEIEYDVTETITLIAGGGYIYESDDPDGITYGRATLEWAPGGDFESELTGRVHSRPGSDLGYEISFSAAKSFE